MSVEPGKVGGGGSSGILFSPSILIQASQTITFLAFEATTSVIVVTSTSMSVSQVVSTTATTLTISVSATVITTSSRTATASPPPASPDEIPLLHDSIIVASVLGGFIILLISTLALIYYLYKRRKHQQELDYSPPFTSLAPPPRSVLSPLTIHSSQVHPEEPRETSLSMGPGIHTSTTTAESTQRHSNGTAQQSQHQQRDSISPILPLPAILLQPSTRSPTTDTPHNPPARPRAQSRLYHDLLREETELEAARRHGRLDAAPAAPLAALRPTSEFSDISDIDTGQFRRPSGEGEREGERERERERGGERERARGFPSTRASSGVFPDD